MATGILNADDIKKVLDTFKNPNSLDCKDFFKMMQKKNINPEELFNKLDRDDSGSLGEEELKSLLKVFDENARDLTKNEISLFFKEIDKDKSGEIDKKEFVDFARIQATLC